jgi:hypothetical protein
MQDSHIPAGSEWDAILEERIQSCRAVILFLSNAAVDSKYVRREVKYADTINKPILAVEMEEVRLRHGLDMLLSQLQRVNARHALDMAHLRDLLRNAGY